MQLVQVVATRCNRLRISVVVEPLPARARVPGARLAQIAPDRSVVVELKQVVNRCRDCCRTRVVVHPLPTRTRVAGTGLARVAPDRPVIVELVQVAPSGGNSLGTTIIV